MKKQIKTYKYEKIEVNSTEIEIPEEPMYVFQTGIRRAIRIIPQWTTWNKEYYQKDEEIYALDVVCVYNCWDKKIEIDEIQISQIESILANDKEGKSIPYMLLHKLYNARTKEQFNADLQAVIDRITPQGKPVEVKQ